MRAARKYPPSHQRWWGVSPLLLCPRRPPSPPFCAPPLFPPLARFVVCCCPAVVVVVVVPPPFVCSPPPAGPHCRGPRCLVLVVFVPLVPFPVVLLSSCLRRRWLVDCPALLFHPRSTPRAVAREAGRGWCSSSLASRSGPFVAVVVLGVLVWFVVVPLLLLGLFSLSWASFHPQSTPRAVAREAGCGWCVVAVVFVAVVFACSLPSFSSCRFRRFRRRSTHDPPHEQLLVRLGMGGVSRDGRGGGAARSS
jgi:hypothetical protein